MLVPLELLRTVVFLGEKTGPLDDLGGTAYFVSVPSMILEGRRHIYLVTAAHCVKDRRGLIARLNAPGGGTTTVDLPDGDSGEWSFHPQPAVGEDSVDLAAIRWPDPTAAYEAGYRWVTQSMFFDQSMLGDDVIRGVGIGDDVVSIGLLTVHSGHERNEPVLRTGNIAMVPEDPVLVRYAHGQDLRMRLILTELRSVAGLSGSPVFVRHRAMIAQPEVPISLLGTMIGHWDDPAGNHMGFGKVVPARLLSELLGQEKLMTEREQLEQARSEGDPVAHADSSI